MNNEQYLECSSGEKSHRQSTSTRLGSPGQPALRRVWTWDSIRTHCFMVGVSFRVVTVRLPPLPASVRKLFFHWS